MYGSYLVIRTGKTKDVSMPIFISSDKNAKIFYDGIKSLCDMKIQPFTYDPKAFPGGSSKSIDKFISLWNGKEMSALEIGFKALMFSTIGTEFCDWTEDSGNNFDIRICGEATDVDINLLSNIPDDQLAECTVEIFNRLNRPSINPLRRVSYLMHDIDRISREENDMGTAAIKFSREINRIANKRSILWGDSRESSAHAVAARYGLYLGMARLVNENITNDIFETIILQVMDSGHAGIPDFWWTGHKFEMM